MLEIFIVVTFVEILTVKKFCVCVCVWGLLNVKSFKLILKFKIQFVDQQIYEHQVKNKKQ
jgi:hypothetical protein